MDIRSVLRLFDFPRRETLGDGQVCITALDDLWTSLITMPENSTTTYVRNEKEHRLTSRMISARTRPPDSRGSLPEGADQGRGKSTAQEASPRWSHPCPQRRCAPSRLSMRR
jgi:hypothetical protein